MYERGEREPGLESMETIADYFNVDLDYLMGRSDIPNRNDWLKSINKSVVVEPSQPQMKFDNIIPISTKRFPLLGDIACGKPIMANEEKELYVEAGANISADFCLRAKGDSMIGARIYDGDIVFIKKQEMVDNGEIAVKESFSPHIAQRSFFPNMRFPPFNEYHFGRPRPYQE